MVVSGWQVYDNKGQVVQKYEPFFAAGFGYGQPQDAQLGQKVTMFYDPRGRVVRTVSRSNIELRSLSWGYAAWWYSLISPATTEQPVGEVTSRAA